MLGWSWLAGCWSACGGMTYSGNGGASGGDATESALEGVAEGVVDLLRLP
jgi:hypothetical protein